MNHPIWRCLLRIRLNCETTVRRQSSTDNKTKKANVIKRVNYDTKAMFGGVLKKTDTKQATPPTETEGELSSELYWITQSMHRMPLGKAAKTVKPKKLNPTAIQSSASVAHNPIPFSIAELRALTKVPLLSSTNALPGSLSIDAAALADMPSVGKILQATMPDASRKALQVWKLKMLAEHGADGFAAIQQSHLDRGSTLHSNLQTYFNKGVEPTSDAVGIEAWRSVSPVLARVSREATLVEASIYHPVLRYKGIVDCVSLIGDNLSVIEWKKSDKPKPTIAATYDAPLQLCAYLGALNADYRHQLRISHGAVVVAYTNGQPAEFFQLTEIDLKKYWRVWVARVHNYWTMRRDGTLPEPI